MDEDQNAVLGEQNAADETDGFSEGWDESESPYGGETVDEPGGTDSGSEELGPQSEPQADQEEPGTSQEAQDEPASEAPPQMWQVQTDHGPVSVDADTMQALAQRGLAYDNIVRELDSTRPVMELFSTFAQQAGMSVPDYVSYIREQAKIAGGMSEEDARHAVELEDREQIIAQREAEEQQRQEEEQRQTELQRSMEQRRNQDIQEFMATFPDAAADPSQIPQAVWDQVNAGKTLVSAYALYLVQQTRETQAAQAQAQKNAARSAGSMRSAGGDTGRTDPFLQGWNEG